MHKHSDSLIGTFYRGPVSDFMDYIDGAKALPCESTLFVGFNPGFGSGYDILLNSWCVDIVQLINTGYPIIFTQANDYSDQRGELRVFETIFEGKAKFVLEP